MRHLRFISECHSTAQWKSGLFLPQYPYGLFDWKHCMESERRISIDKALEPTASPFPSGLGAVGAVEPPTVLPLAYARYALRSGVQFLKNKV